MIEEKDTKEREYEISFWLKNESDLEKVKSILADFNCQLTYAGELRRMQMAYPIKKETAGFFGFLHFQADPSIIGDLRKELQVEGGCLRFMIVSNPIKKHQEKDRPKTQVKEKKEEKVEQRSSGIITNEELEKKLEEILK
jgi:small subunit ribosomal protein S6